jgi:hypothetical protein
MGFLDKAKKMAERAAPLIDKAAPHAREVADKAGQQIDKRTGGKYRDKIEQVEAKVGELADKRMASGGTGPAGTTDDAFPPTPPPVTAPTPGPVDSAGPVDPTETSTPIPPAVADTDDPSAGTPGHPAG